MKKDNLYQKRFCLGRLYSKRYRLRKKFFKKLLLEWGFNKRANVADIVWEHTVRQMLREKDWFLDEFKPVFNHADDNDLMINFARHFKQQDNENVVHKVLNKDICTVNIENYNTHE